MAEQEFSEWVHAMRRHQGPVSESSSWADTDSDSDSDSDDAFQYTAAQSAVRTSKKMALERTSPMMIPACTRRRRSYFVNEFDESAPQKQRMHRDFYDNGDFAASVDDEDDPALYQNLAYFRSQNAHKHSHKLRSRSSSPAPASVSASSDNDDIFDMEL